MTIYCTLFSKEYKVKKVCKIPEMPKNAKYYTTAYFDKLAQDIYRTDAGILYATKEKN